MKEIKVGDYVRTKRGIAKVLEVKTVQPKMYGKHDVDYLIDKCPRMYISETAFIKHSKNIIDLIEVGDMLVMLDTKFNTKDYIFINDIEMLQAVRVDLKDRCKLISILTKEQYMQNCYKIPEKSSGND